MSLDIEYATTCNTKEEFIKKRDDLKQWVEKILKEQWNPMSYNNKDIKVFDRPQENGKHFLMSKTTIKANMKKFYEYIQTATFQQQQDYDDLTEYEKDQSFPEDQIDIIRCVYKGPWPITPRDFIILQTWYEQDGSYYFIHESINYHQKWNTPNKNYVRGFKQVGLIFKPNEDGSYEVTRLVATDPRGSVPTALVGACKKDDVARLVKMKKFVESSFAN